jgi:hypothetical protein
MYNIFICRCVKNFLICLQVFGACGSRKCEGPSCWQMAGRKYKFYLSLENSICKVTPEPEFVNIEGALESILRNRFCQPM